MCVLITVGVDGASAAKPAEVFREHRLHAAPAENASVRALMSGRGLLLDVTDGRCSCGLRASTGPVQRFDEAAERARYARKGWSPAKIERAIAAKRIAHSRPKPEALPGPEQLRDSIEALVRSGASICLYAHEYHGAFADESVPFKGETEVSLRQYLDGLGRFPDDTMITIKQR